MKLRLLNTDNSSQWENRRDNAAAHGGCRHKSIHWSINRQGPPLITKWCSNHRLFNAGRPCTVWTTQTWANYANGPNVGEIKGLNWTITTEHRTEMGSSIGTLEMRTLNPSGNWKDRRNETTI